MLHEKQDDSGSALKILKEQDFQLWILYSTKLSPKQQVEQRHFQVNENLNDNKNMEKNECPSALQDQIQKKLTFR